MPRKQTRRSISVKGITYLRLTDYMNQCGETSYSGVVDKLIHEKLDSEGFPAIDKDDPRVRALKSELPGAKPERPKEPVEPAPDDFESGVKLL